ncbi:MAG: DUF4327 family protein [Leptolyngbyaceae cyanobacterium MO_188.B28]|nr:DUF4327 family protein [Leptolyngbyaceae cyanobacterium MO_188.B28]
MQAVQSVPTQSQSFQATVSRQYTIDMIRDEARQLVYKGVLSHRQPILALCKCIPAREWVHVEQELENNEFLLRDQIIDLLGREDWSDD